MSTRRGRNVLDRVLKRLLNGKACKIKSLTTPFNIKARKYNQAFKQTDCIYKRFCSCSTVTKCLYFSSSYNVQKYGKIFVSLSSAGTKNPTVLQP